MTEKLAAEIVKKSGIMRDTGMTSATPKPRAGEHTSETDAEARRFADGDYVADYVSASFARRLEAERDLLRARERQLVAALAYCGISTRADGQWADQSVHTFLLSVLAKHGR